MNIKDIAKLANVSISTVSKVVNNKADEIPIETREKILKLVKEYHYVPYGNKIQKSANKSYIIAVLLKETNGNSSIIDGILQIAKQNNYAVMIFDSNNSLKDEEKNFSSILKHHVDAVIWKPVSIESEKLTKQFIDNKIKFVAINTDDSAFPNNNHIDFEALGFDSTEQLFAYKHSVIACIVKRNSFRSESIISGIKKSFFQNQILWDESFVFYDDELSNINFLQTSFTAIICSHYYIANKLIKELHNQNINVPSQISCVTFQDSKIVKQDDFLSIYDIPYFEFGSFVSRHLFAEIDQMKFDANIPQSISINHHASIDYPAQFREKNIIVVGSGNLDIYFNVKDLPRQGETISIDASLTLAGGKGVNQSIGVSKLRKRSHLICKLGCDYKSAIIKDALEKNNVNTSALVYDKQTETGVAYIHVNKKGDSCITIVKGANATLSASDIRLHEDSFANTKICLLQTEVSEEAITEAAKLAKHYQATTILKPSTLQKFSKNLGKFIDIVVPSEFEANQLFPNMEKKEQAKKFIELGIKDVIITMGDKGCYVYTEKKEYYFHAPNVVVVDTTGASDAFISTLAVYLSEDKGLVEAVPYATAAAGYCISKFGVEQSMVDRETLEKFMNIYL